MTSNVSITNTAVFVSPQWRMVTCSVPITVSNQYAEGSFGERFVSEEFNEVVVARIITDVNVSLFLRLSQHKHLLPTKTTIDIKRSKLEIICSEPVTYSFN